MNRNEFFQALPLTKLALRLNSAALEICTDDIEDVHVMISGADVEAEALRVAAAADVLTVEQPVSPRSLLGTAGSGWMQITLRLPRTWKGAIEARSVSGRMNIRSVAGTDMSLDTVSGLVMVTDVSFLTLSARAVTGDVKLNQTSADKVGLFSTSGSLTAADSAFKTGSASTVSGDVTLDLASPFEELTLNTVAGELTVRAPMTQCSASLRSVSGRIHAEGVEITEGAPKLRATSVSSDLELSCNLE